jgi:5,6,7,8-tetrahydromethanopterin hydro-lyase
VTPQVGEGFAGDGVDAAHVNTVLGLRDGPVGTAWATALATPSAGHTPFVVVVRPNVPVVPFTLFVNKAAIAGDRHGALTWGAAQAGIAAGVGKAFVEAVLRVPGVDVRQLCLIAAVWVNPDAADEEAVFVNNRDATYAAIGMGVAQGPSLDVLRNALRTDPENPYFRAR